MNGIIVNADDFGMSSSVNRAIIEAFKRNWISTTTIMSNMPGYEEATEFIEQYKLFDRIGIHLNLTEGNPLTSRILKEKRFCSESKQLTRNSNYRNLTYSEKIAVVKELQAQVNKCLSSGITPSHIDSHHHIHHLMEVGRLFWHIAVKNKIPSVRLFPNWGQLTWKRKIHGRYYNLFLKSKKLAATKYFCEIRSVTPDLLHVHHPIEIMVHPCLNHEGKLINYIHGENLEYLIKKHLPNIKLTTYARLNTR